MNRDESGKVVIAISDRFKENPIRYTLTKTNDYRYLLTWVSPRRGPDSMHYTEDTVHRYITETG